MNHTNTFAHVGAASAALHETRDCSVKALALICRVSYETALWASTQAGRERADGTPLHVTRKALKLLGFRVRREWDGRRLGLEVGVRGRPTVAHAHHEPEAWEHLPDLLLFSDQHVSALVAGRVEDWAQNEMRPVEDAWEVVQEGDETLEHAPDVIYLGHHHR